MNLQYEGQRSRPGCMIWNNKYDALRAAIDMLELELVVSWLSRNDFGLTSRLI